MLLVVDTSVLLAVVLNEPSKAELVRLTTGAGLIAPLSLHWEFGNALSSMTVSYTHLDVYKRQL